MDKEFEVTLDFSDITLAKTDGIFKDVKKIMTSSAPHNDEWMIRTSATLVSKFGIAEMNLHFYGNGKVYIMDYSPSSYGDVFYNPDLAALSEWTNQSGWKKAEPCKDLIFADKEFWKHFYDTYLVDSDYFEQLFGKRDEMDL